MRKPSIARLVVCLSSLLVLALPLVPAGTAPPVAQAAPLPPPR